VFEGLWKEISLVFEGLWVRDRGTARGGWKTIRSELDVDHSGMNGATPGSYHITRLPISMNCADRATSTQLITVSSAHPP
jgi:hypothetical protein